jgi:preprotein translocase subunit SecA
MLNIITKLFDTNQREIKSIEPVIQKINALEPEYKTLKKADFAGKTEEFKLRLSQGETLDQILPDAFAAVRQASIKTVGLRHFDVQMVAAVGFHQGKVSEQKTGEGKTLSATLALYLNALAGRGVHLVTVNDYLAQRDAGWNGPIFDLLGVSVGVIIHDNAFIFDPDFNGPDRGDSRLEHLKPVTRKEAYLADITYGTSSEFGFDYLRDNMAQTKEDKVQRGHFFAVIDEVDSILIDEARTPLIISAPDTEPTDKYVKFAQIIQELTKDGDYEVDEKLRSASLTDYGIKHLERILGIENLYEKDYDTVHHIEQALKAKTLFFKDREYVVKDNQIIIVDEQTGRLMYGRRYSDGLHQAIEAKEGVPIQKESKTLATVSIQNYFRMYEKLAGMTGTAETEAEEFKKIYDVDVLVVPTNQPVQRTDFPDVVYKTTRAKYGAIIKEIEELHHKGQPILVGTKNIDQNEILHSYLKRKKIPHQILNAKHHEQEAQIISNAGRPQAVTLATNIAGRGVDIVLGGATPEDKTDKKALKKWQADHDLVVKLGGLHVIGTQRHESRRIDNQLRGRSGRQGDPGSSRFYVALDDDIMRIFGGEQVARLMTALKIPEDQPIEAKLVSRSIQQAQTKVEGFHFDQRKHLVEYDDVLNKQREIIYKRRDNYLELDPTNDPEPLVQKITDIVNRQIELLVNARAPQGLTSEEINAIVKEFVTIIPFDDTAVKKLHTSLKSHTDSGDIITKLQGIAENAIEQRITQLGKHTFADLSKFTLLRTMDDLWIEHLDAVEDLRQGIWLRGSQEMALSQYKKEAYDLFEKLINTIDHQVSRRILRTQVVFQPAAGLDLSAAVEQHPESTEITEPTPAITTTASGAANNPFAAALAKTAHREVPKNRGMKVTKLGRNDPCWCGSGKKWKKCHYPQLTA